MDNLLQVTDLKTYFYTSDGDVPAVDGVSFHIRKGETLGLVGESGSGKSITALSLLRLIPDPPGKIISGEICYEGESLLGKTDPEMRKIRGNKISMIFQEPMTSLNPVYTIGYQIREVLTLHQGLTRKSAREKAIGLLQSVGFAMPEQRIEHYPHQLSGGMRQRAMIAMALSCQPGLLIADEPTTALDVTIQAQILDIMKELKERTGMSILLITHDLGVVSEIADRVIVMYAGQIVESARVDMLFSDPKHPYAKGLLQSIPRLDVDLDRLYVIKGVIPKPTDYPTGCRFHPRCDMAWDKCSRLEPVLENLGHDRQVRCWLYSP
ncbi:MAG: ABC transporter ATP-binding protein [Desulfatirhabdiaceae bacterium]